MNIPELALKDINICVFLTFFVSIEKLSDDGAREQATFVYLVKIFLFF